MTIIHKAFAEIRELRHEELDLVGGAWSSEPTQLLTTSAISVCGTPTGCITVTVTDDVLIDMNPD